ncbi:MAG: undecaprenyl-diphosphatase UppP [Chloroflexi bacterium RBG_16_48_8]|nr:MAG: undecaprenyl-diphosphatase UppP [Chloroflexi bacterium RBG_16_48_8]
MTLLQALVLGIVQGLTEFIPISSTGHLVLVPALLGWEFNPQSAFIFDVLVQWGTLLAVIAYFKDELITLSRGLWMGFKQRQIFTEPNARLAWLILLSSLPAAIAGLILKPLVESAIDNILAVFVFLLVNALILFASERISRFGRRLQDLGVADSLWIGFAQIFALFPGISRSGSTIAAGLVRNLERGDAARYSFLMALPVMLGAGLVALFDLTQSVDASAQVGPLLVGFLAAALVGYLTIRWLLKFLAQRSLNVFAAYCFIVGLVGVLMVMLNG